MIDIALRRFPEDMGILMLGHDVYRFLDQQEDSLPLARQLIRQFPSQAHGYTRLVDDLVTLKRFNEAMTTIELGLQQTSAETQLVRLGDYVGQYLKIAPATHSLEGMSTTVLSMRDMISYSHIPSFLLTFSPSADTSSSPARKMRLDPQPEKIFCLLIT